MNKPVEMATLTGAHHFSFSDQSLLKSQYLMKAISSVGRLESSTPVAGFAFTTTYVHTLFDVYLKGTPASELTNVCPQYPEVQIDTH